MLSVCCFFYCDWPLLFNLFGIFFSCFTFSLLRWFGLCKVFCLFCSHWLPALFLSPGFFFAHWTSNLYRSLGSWMTNHRWICIKFRFVFVVVLNCTQTQTPIYVLWSSDFIAFIFIYNIYKLLCVPFFCFTSEYCFLSQTFHVDFDFE